MTTASERVAKDSLSPKVTENCDCIMVRSKEQHFQYQVFDVRGLLISQEKCEGELLRVDKTMLEQGVYILKVYTKTSAFTHKFNVY